MVRTFLKLGSVLLLSGGCSISDTVASYLDALDYANDAQWECNNPLSTELPPSHPDITLCLERIARENPVAENHMSCMTPAERALGTCLQESSCSDGEIRSCFNAAESAYEVCSRNFPARWYECYE